MNGYEAIAQIRQEEARLASSTTHKTLIIVLTASVFEEDINKILAVGGNEVINKPFQESVLLETIASQLSIDLVYGNLDSNQPSDQDNILSETEITGLLASATTKWLTQFHSATIELDEAYILGLISQLDDSFQQLSHTLETLLHDFKFDLITKCTEEAMSINDKQ